MNRSMQGLVVALALAVFGAGCAAQTSTDSEQTDQSMIVKRAQLDQGGSEKGGSSVAPGEQQVNLDIAPASEVQGPVPDPWVGAGPVPDPWNPGGDPHHPKERLSAAASTGADGTPSGNNK